MTASFSKPVSKAVFPVAGLGTRFLPATKASPKEMLNVVDKPLDPVCGGRGNCRRHH
jgi:UTP--glucose-1-phosphate uridylyltransferase